MGIRIWLDDVRDPPPDSGEWVICRTAHAAGKLLTDPRGVDHIAFDHDLGLMPDAMKIAPTGYDLARRVFQLVTRNEIPCPTWSVHSANPVGAKNIDLIMTDAMAYQRQQEGEPDHMKIDQREGSDVD